eukprot:1751624-Pyramimonas_sp.AAC.1
MRGQFIYTTTARNSSLLQKALETGPCQTTLRCHGERSAAQLAGAVAWEVPGAETAHLGGGV